MKLIAARDMRYRTRRMKAGEELDVPDLLGAILLKKKNKFRKASEEKPQTMPIKPDSQDEIDKLRTQAQSAGVHVDRRWGPRRLTAEISNKKPG